MKKTIHRLYKRYKYLLLLTLCCIGLIWLMPAPVNRLGYILHFVAVLASGIVLGRLYYSLKDYCRMHRPIIARVKGQRA